MGERDTPPRDDCPLGVREQTRNVLIVGINTALCYLAAPVMYVDVHHTSLMNKLQEEAGGKALASLSNLPSSAYMVFSVLPLLVAWAFPQVRRLRPILVVCYSALALASLAVAAVLLLPVPWWLKAVVVVGHGAVLGGARTVAVACEFEVLGVAVAESRRGQALGLAYGLGPFLAILGSLLAQWMVTGKLALVADDAPPSSERFALLFGCSVPVMALGALLCSKLVVPLPEREAARQPFLAGVFGGFGRFLGRPVVRRRGCRRWCWRPSPRRRNTSSASACSAPDSFTGSTLPTTS
jgi:hypothetical protein